MANETTDVVILQLKIDEGTGKKLPEAKKEVEVLAGSIVGLAKANKQLREERNKLDTQTAEGAKRIQELNKLIDENNDLIKQNSSNLEKQRMNVGNYKRGVTDALKEVRIGGINVGDVVDKLSKANEDLFQGMIQGWKDSGVSAKLFGTTARTALTLTGIGILIAALGTIVAYWDDISEAIGLADSEQKKFLDNSRAELEYQNGLLARRLQLLELYGASQSELNKLTIPNLQEQIKLNDLEIAQLEKEIKLAKFRNDLFFDHEEREKSIDALKKSNEDLAGQITFLLAKEQKETTEANEKRVKEEEETLKKLKDQRDKDAKEQEKERTDAAKLKADESKAALEAYQARLDAEHEIYIKDKERREEAENQKVEIMKRFNDRIIKETKARADQEVKIERSKDNVLISAKLGVVNQISGIIGQLAGKNKALGIASVVIEKAAAIAQIISNTAIANAKAIAVSPITGGQPWVAINTASGIAAGVATAAQAAKSIQEISSAKFAEGGGVRRGNAYRTIGGKSHAQGGTKFWGEDGTFFEAEAGEGLFVMKKSANKEYLSTLNQKHGGRSWGNKTWYAAQGGQIEARDIAGRSRSNESVARILAASISSMPNPVVYVADIREGVNTAVETEVRSAPM